MRKAKYSRLACRRERWRSTVNACIHSYAGRYVLYTQIALPAVLRIYLWANVSTTF